MLIYIRGVIGRCNLNAVSLRLHLLKTAGAGPKDLKLLQPKFFPKHFSQT